MDTVEIPIEKLVPVEIKKLTNMLLELNNIERQDRAIEYRVIPADVAYTLQLLDQEEHYVHVEFRDDGEWAEIWNPFFWKMDIRRRERELEESRLNKAEWDFNKERLDQIRNAIANTMSLDLKADKTLINALAQKMLEMEPTKAKVYAKTVYNYELKYYDRDRQEAT